MQYFSGLGFIDSEDPFGIKKTKKQVKLLFTDVKTEGKKQGYERASKEYESVFRKVAKEYNDTKKILDDEIATNDEKIEALIVRLEKLEKKRKKLESDVNKKTRQVSDSYDVPIGDVTAAMASGTLLYGGMGFSLLDVICSIKERKMIEAEQAGYQEAKELYLQKIDKLKKKLNNLRKESNAKIKELVKMAEPILKDIADEELKIGDLNILLNR